MLLKVVRRARNYVTTRGRGRVCPLCDWEGGHFLPHGRHPKERDDARCPRCGSLERDRLARVILGERIAPGQITLHSAPERCIQPWLKSLSAEYLSIDLDGAMAARAMNLTALDLPDDSKTLLYCSNVLEHIPDDRAAMREMKRVLKPGGHAVIMVPIRGAETDEDLTVTNPEDRLVRYTQRDHVRFYGLDITDRLTDAGFAVETLDAESLSPEIVERHSLTYPTTRQIFYCEA